MGASADGLESLQTPKTQPGWLAGQYIIWAPAIAYDVLMPQGAYKEKFIVDWLNGLTMPDESVVQDNLNTIWANEMHSEFWDEIEVSGMSMINDLWFIFKRL